MAALLIYKVWTLMVLIAASLLMGAAVPIVLYNQEMKRALIPFSVLVLVLISIPQHI